MVWLPEGEKKLDTFFPFYRIYERDGRTDGQTTLHDSIDRAYA